jgi:TP901 family phage tail tape measure protein
LPPARKITVEIVGDSKSLERAFGKSAATGDVWGKRMEGAGHAAGRTFKTAGLLVAGGAALMGVGLVKAANAAGDFQSELNVFQSVAGATGRQMKAVSDLAIKLGNDGKLPATSAKDAADAMLEEAKAGLSVGDSMHAARGTLLLAAAAGGTATDAAKMTTAALNAFGLKGTYATKVADELAGAANASAADIGDMGEAMQMSAAVFAKFQGPAVGAKSALLELNTAIAVLANAGIKGSDAGTSLKQMLLQLTGPSNRAKDAMRALYIAAEHNGASEKDLGVIIRGTAKVRGASLSDLEKSAKMTGEGGDIAYTAAGKMRSLSDIVRLVSAGTKDMTQEQRNAYLTQIFGADAVRAITILMGAQGKKARELGRDWDTVQKKVNENGIAQKVAAARMKGYRGEIAQLSNTLDTLQITVGLAVLPALTHVVHGINGVAGAFSGFVTKILAAKGIQAKIGVVVDGLQAAGQDIATFARKSAARIEAAMAGVDWGAVGHRIGAGVSAGFHFSVAALDGAMNTISDWINGNSAKIGEIGATLFANMVATLLDPSFWAKHWELGLSIALAVIPAGRLATIGGKMMGFLLKPMTKLGELMAPFVVNALRSIGIGAAVAADAAGAKIGDLLYAGIAKVAGKIGGLVSTLTRPFGSVGVAIAHYFDQGAELVASSARSLAQKAGTALAGGLRAMAGGVTGAASGLAKGATGAISHLWGALPALVRGLLKVGILDILVHAVASAGSAAANLGQSVLHGLNEKLSHVAGTVRQWLGQIPGEIASVGAAAVGAAEQIGRDIAEGIAHGITSMAGSVVSAATGVVGSALGSIRSHLKINSPSLLFSQQVGAPIAEGIAHGITMKGHLIAKALTTKVMDAVKQARGNLLTITQGLASQVDQILDSRLQATLGNLDAGNADSSDPRVQQLRAVLAQQATKATAEQQAQLNDAKAQADKAVADAQASIAAATDPQTLADAQAALAQAIKDQQQAQQDLDDWSLDQQRQTLEAQIQASQDAAQKDNANKKAAIEQNLADLANAYNRGQITFQQFHDAEIAYLRDTLGPAYADAGSILGSAFADNFTAQLAAIDDQLKKLAGFTQLPGGGQSPDITDPTAVQQAQIKAYNDAVAKWQAAINRRDDEYAAKNKSLQDSAKEKSSPGGTTITAAEWDRIASAMQDWSKSHPIPPHPRIDQFANGGWPSRGTLFVAGEEGGELVLPYANRPQRTRQLLEQAGLDGGSSSPTIHQHFYPAPSDPPSAVMAAASWEWRNLR